ncbi:ACT domain-containing protein [Microbacterium sp. ZW T5_45]|uniref:ACT domain-containing protein n=1 Tax=Microbacterium sp. ZW T5_45 TaxID=3378080 RepID=UPI0038542DB8
MTTLSMELQQLAGEYVIARFPAATDSARVLEEAFAAGGFVAVSRTPQELTVVCTSGLDLPGAEVDGPWVALYASGPMPFGLTGVVASLVSPLSAVNCAVFVVSTFDGDVLMVPVADASRARGALLEAGHVLA